MTSCSWIWLYVGAFLMLMELLAPGFVIFFFGLSAATVGLCRAAFGESFDLTWQLAAFSVFSILYLVILRRFLKRIFQGEKACATTDFDHEHIGRVGKVVQAIEPPLDGRIVLGDAEWAAEAEAPIPVGASVRVISQNNLTLKVEVMQ